MASRRMSSVSGSGSPSSAVGACVNDGRSEEIRSKSVGMLPPSTGTWPLRFRIVYSTLMRRQGKYERRDTSILARRSFSLRYCCIFSSLRFTGSATAEDFFAGRMRSSSGMIS